MGRFTPLASNPSILQGVENRRQIEAHHLRRHAEDGNQAPTDPSADRIWPYLQSPRQVYSLEKFLHSRSFLIEAT